MTDDGHVIFEGGLFQRKKSNLWILIRIPCFIFIIIKWVEIFSNPIFKNMLWDYYPYVLLCLLFFLIYYQALQKIKYQSLYEKYKDANRKLADYSQNIAALATVKERNRIAGEIHDAMGHSLTALIMHLDFLKRIDDKSSDIARDVLEKSRDLAKETLSDVRKVVLTYKEASQSKGFLASVKEMVAKFTSVGMDIRFSFDASTNDIPPNIQNILYKIIMESITNSINHGKAGLIEIDLHKCNNELRLEIQDNGQGSEAIHKGNGLKWIEERVGSVGGDVKFFSKNGNGFRIEVYIPS